MAAMLGRVEVVLLLVQAGADTTLMDSDQRTPDLVARQYGHHMVADIINRCSSDSVTISAVHN